MVLIPICEVVSVHKLGMGSAYVSIPYRRAMRGSSNDFQQCSGLDARVFPAVKPMSIFNL